MLNQLLFVVGSVLAWHGGFILFAPHNGEVITPYTVRRKPACLNRACVLPGPLSVYVPDGVYSHEYQKWDKGRSQSI